MKKKIPVLKNEFSQDQSGINLVLFYPSLTYNENEFNKRTEKNLTTTWVYCLYTNDKFLRPGAFWVEKEHRDGVFLFPIENVHFRLHMFHTAVEKLGWIRYISTINNS